MLARLNENKEGSKCLKVLRTRFPTNSLYTPMGNTPLHSLSSVGHPWVVAVGSGGGEGDGSASSKASHTGLLQHLTESGVLLDAPCFYSSDRTLVLA